MNTESNSDDYEDVEAIVELTVTLQQKGYRYSNFGTFEETLGKSVFDKKK